MPNRLADATSPYLLQHQDNPVDWYPWGEEALTKAREEDKPIFLSVGYSSCHWCHVMERESFENPEIAAVLNEHFVSIKVDREERPDIDHIYMQAVQMMTGSGGWPMSVFLTPEGRPFFAGTYWPPESRWGRPGFKEVLLAVADAWRNKRAQVEQQGVQMSGYLQEAVRNMAGQPEELSAAWIAAADRWLLEHYDARHGGFGGAPKFPHALDLSLWIELDAEHPDPSRRQAIVHTLEHMARGGIFDHLGGGFARYSVDERWLVPHFEKMLYDNALLAVVYADAYRLWKEPWLKDILDRTIEYVLRDLRHPEGGFFSSEDADSEGVEGKFYVWTREEILQVLGRELGGLFCEAYGVTEAGNFEGKSILHLPLPLGALAERLGGDVETLDGQLREARQLLFQQRSQRVRPGRDEKVLTSWNALMIRGLMHAYRATANPGYRRAAHEALAFLRQALVDEHGQLWHAWRDGQPAAVGFLEDYAYLLEAIIEVVQVDPSAAYLDWAVQLADTMLDQFSAPAGGFYFTGSNSEQLIVRHMDLLDSSVPSSNASAARGLLGLGRLLGDTRYEDAAHRALQAAGHAMANHPQATAYSLSTLNVALAPPREVVLVNPPEERGESLATQLLAAMLPTTLCLVATAEQASSLADRLPLLAGRALDDEPRLYVCSRFTCQQPVCGDQIAAAIRSLAPQPMRE
ncbi:MAG: thioredoxin domain-containing protein [Pirellulaceae bacterium]|nr:MAG: thioredoxin domain-containing protein [Pirellulaceae bacterium]